MRIWYTRLRVLQNVAQSGIHETACYRNSKFKDILCKLCDFLVGCFRKLERAGTKRWSDREVGSTKGGLKQDQRHAFRSVAERGHFLGEADLPDLLISLPYPAPLARAGDDSSGSPGAESR